MEYLFAPMEGITFSVFRRIHNEMFPGADAYFSPFIAPDTTGSFKPKYLSDLTADRDSGVRLVPQILANNSEPFIITARKLQELGFDEINLNAGCPSGTVFAKHKGSGMLCDLDALDRFLDSVFSAGDIKLSIKTRMGVDSTSEFSAIMKVYRKYPIHRLIVHARDRKGMYRSAPDLESFAAEIESCDIPMVYNGNIYTENDVKRVEQMLGHPVDIMIGRGAVTDPSIFRRLKGGTGITSAELMEYHNRLTEAYLETISPCFVVPRMKELWHYMQALYPNEERRLKTLFKARTLSEYLSAANALLSVEPTELR